MGVARKQPLQNNVDTAPLVSYGCSNVPVCVTQVFECSVGYPCFGEYFSYLKLIHKVEVGGGGGVGYEIVLLNNWFLVAHP